MSLIKISELRPTGSELFLDSESYLHELSAQDMGIIAGENFLVTPIYSLNKFLVNTKFSFSVGISGQTASLVSDLFILR